MPHSTLFKFKTFQGLSGLADVTPDWQKCLSKLKQSSYSQSPIWYRAYLDHISPAPESIFFAAVYCDDELVAIAPLENKIHNFNGFKFRVLGLPDHYHFGLKDLVISDQFPPSEICEFLISRLKQISHSWDLIYLEGITEDAATDRGIDTKNSPFRLKADKGACDLIEITDYERMVSGFSRNFRGALRKARNKLSQCSNVKVTCSRDKEELPKLYDQFLDLEASGWKGKSGTCSAIKLNPSLSSFYRQSMLDFSENGESEINVLEVDEVPIAAQYSIAKNKVVYLLKIGFNENYAKLAPGNMLLEHMLKKYRQEGNVTHVNLITDASWHRSWNPLQQPKVNIYVCNKTLGGLRFLFLYHVKNTLLKRIRGYRFLNR